MTRPEWLEDHEVEAVAHEIAVSFPNAGPITGSVLGGRFQSHTSAFYELVPSSGEGPIALLKVGEGWDAQEAQRIYQDLITFGGVLDMNEADLRVAPALGWHGEPPAICLKRIAGDDLGRLLRSSDAATAAEHVTIVRACGEALGLFHREMPADPDDPGKTDARSDLVGMARAIRVRPWFLDEIDLDVAMARRYGDFAPYNIRVDGQGGGWIIDQPSAPVREPVHRDVAWFLFNVERRLGWDVPTQPAQLDQARSALRASFLEGYRQSGPVPLDTPADRSLLALYRAHRSLWTARRRFRQGEFREVAAYLRLAMRWRAAASRRG